MLCKQSHIPTWPRSGEITETTSVFCMLPHENCVGEPRTGYSRNNCDTVLELAKRTLCLLPRTPATLKSQFAAVVSQISLLALLVLLDWWAVRSVWGWFRGCEAARRPEAGLC